MITIKKLSSNFLKLLLTAVLFTGCKEIQGKKLVQEAATEEEKLNPIVVKGGDEIYTVEKDSCEYIVYDGYHSGNIIHKQNCRFCLQRSSK